MSSHAGLPNVSRLTSEEINTLDVAASLRLLGEYTNIAHDLNTLTNQANEDMLMARIRLDQCKNTLRVLKQNMTVLQTICRSA